jgi:integrase
LPALKKSTADLYADVLDLHLTPVLGEMFVDAITKEDILELRDKWAAKGARPATVNGRLRILRQCLSVICDEAEIADPSKHVSGVRMPRVTTPKGLEPHDAGKLLKALGEMTDDRGPAYYALALLLASTGLRWGEATALLWSDIDLERLDVVVSRAHVRGHVDTTKTDCVKRVPLAPLVADALRRLRTKQLRDQAAGLEAGVVFPSRVGTLMRPSSFRKRLATACKTAGVRLITPHGFRHTMNNAAKKVAGGDIVRSITGHVTSEMTEHYSWVNADEKRETVGNVIRLFGVGDPPMTHESGSSGGRSDSEKSLAG